MICAYCGQQIADGVSFCTNCGARIAPEAPTAQSSQFTAPTYQQSYQAQPANQYQQYQQNPAPAATGSMPSKGGAIALIVIGFLCGIIWGVIGVVQYGPMKNAIEAGDSATASKKFRNIAIATGIGVFLNVAYVIGAIALS